MITNQSQASVLVGGQVRLTGNGTMPATASRTWVITERPAGSQIFGYLVGPDFSFVPDAAGTYTVAMTARAGTREAQTTISVEVSE
jgi:hypothetical protein